MNIDSYNSKEVVSYYKKLIRYGLFSHEKKLIDSFFIPTGKTLDIGCGTGRTTIPLQNMGYNVIGIDYSESMIKSARKINKHIEYKVENILDTSFPNDYFDNILFSYNGLMLIEDYSKRSNALKEIQRIIKPNGVFIFTTPFLDNKINKTYWKNKAQKLNYDINSLTWEQQLFLGDEKLDDNGQVFGLHIPFINEIEKMISDSEFSIIFSQRRLDYTGTEEAEDELDDNYLWVIKSKKQSAILP